MNADKLVKTMYLSPKERFPDVWQRYANQTMRVILRQKLNTGIKITYAALAQPQLTFMPDLCNLLIVYIESIC